MSGPVPSPRQGEASAGRLRELAGPLVEALLSLAPVGFAVLDGELRYVAVNARLAEINGLSVAEHLGRPVAEVAPGPADAAEAPFRRVLDTGEPLRELEISGEVPGSPGVVRHWLESAYPVPGPGGRPAAVAVLVWEVSERLRVQRRVEHTLALLDLLLLAAPIGIAFLDRDLRYVRINETLAAANGLPVVDHLGRPVAEVLPQVAPDVEPLLRQVLETGEPVVDLAVETGPTPAQPGRRRHWLVSYYPVIPSSGVGQPEGVGLIVTDVTDRREAERERQRLLAAAQAARVRAELAVSRQQMLARLTAALAGALTVEQVARTVTTLVPAALGATATAISYYDGRNGLESVAGVGLPPDWSDRRWTFSLDEEPLAAEVIRSRRPVLVGSHAERDRRFPHMAGVPVRQQAWANLPLLVDGEPVGLVAFGWDPPRTFPRPRWSC